VRRAPNAPSRLTAWRIVKARYVGNAFDGEGARQNGGRWTSPGSPVVYVAESAALAALELLVHLGRGPALQAYVLIACSFPDDIVSTLDPARLPASWRSFPAPADLQLLGDEWIARKASAVLKVPSAIIETESNYLLNPLHPDFRAVVQADPRPFRFDVRLVQP
jgi:RES domain-containing protein